MAPGALASRPRLTAAILLGVAVGAGLSLVPNPLAWHTRAILSWDLTCGFFLAAAFLQMRGRDLEFMRTRAAFGSYIGTSEASAFTRTPAISIS